MFYITKGKERQNDICQLRKKVHTTHWVLKVGRTSSSVYKKAEKSKDMNKSNLLMSKISGVCLTAIAVFATQISHSACIWWMHQPKEPKGLN